MCCAGEAETRGVAALAQPGPEASTLQRLVYQQERAHAQCTRPAAAAPQPGCAQRIDVSSARIDCARQRSGTIAQAAQNKTCAAGSARMRRGEPVASSPGTGRLERGVGVASAEHARRTTGRLPCASGTQPTIFTSARIGTERMRGGLWLVSARACVCLSCASGKLASKADETRVLCAAAGCQTVHCAAHDLGASARRRRCCGRHSKAAGP